MAAHSRLFFMIIPSLVVKVKGHFSWPWPEYCH